MDLSWILIILSTTVLLSYLFDLVGKRIRVPAVVLLIFTGMALRGVSDFFQYELTFPSQLLPVLGTLGLILIVLEGALDLSITRDKTWLISRTMLLAALGLFLTAGLFAFILLQWFEISVQMAWIYATPFAVISSAVAIPAASALSARHREFVVYESSLSDILGVLLFYELIEYQGQLGMTVVKSGFNIFGSTAVGILAATFLYWLIKRIDTHVRFLPMVFGIALIYAIGKLMHLAPLVTVLVVGLLLNNNQVFKGIPYLRRGDQQEFDDELAAFKQLVAEFTFIVRTFFFILLGYSIQLLDLFDLTAWALALAVLGTCVLPRFLLLRFVLRENCEPLIWFAPRGLITILLFLSIPQDKFGLPTFPQASVLLVVLIWALLLTLGMFRHDPDCDEVAVTPAENADDDATAAEAVQPITQSGESR